MTLASSLANNYGVAREYLEVVGGAEIGVPRRHLEARLNGVVADLLRPLHLLLPRRVPRFCIVLLDLADGAFEFADIAAPAGGAAENAGQFEVDHERAGKGGHVARRNFDRWKYKWEG